MRDRIANLASLAVAMVGMPAAALAAGELQCYEEPGTLSTLCIHPAAARQNGALRSSPLFMGGPKGVRGTAITLVVDCTRNVSTLQDRQGKNFSGGRNSDTEAVRSLSSWLCAVKSPKRDAALRQF